MKRLAILLGAGVLVTLPGTTAGAGPCTAEIDNVTKLLASRDAGAGPTTGAAGATTGQHPQGAPPQHPPSAIMGQATEGRAASPQDVQSQSRGGPSATEQAEGARRPAAESLAAAQAAVEQARGFDQAGRESECMDAIGRAKQHLG